MDFNEVLVVQNDLDVNNRKIQKLKNKVSELEKEIKKYESYYEQETKFENFEIESMIFNNHLYIGNCNRDIKMLRLENKPMEDIVNEFKGNLS